MLPSVLTSQLQTGVEDVLRTTSTRTPRLHGMEDRFLGRNGIVFEGLYVNVDLPFLDSDPGPNCFPAKGRRRSRYRMGVLEHAPPSCVCPIDTSQNDHSRHVRD
jgi:hypothetical protein